MCSALIAKSIFARMPAHVENRLHSIVAFIGYLVGRPFSGPECLFIDGCLIVQLAVHFRDDVRR